MTPSAISHQVKLLEEQFAVQLFHRVHRAVILTDAGRRYAEEVSAAFSRIERAAKELGQTKKSDILTVLSPPSFATQWLMPRLARFSSQHPSVDVHLNASYPPPADLLSQGVDIEIRHGVPRLQPAGTMTLAFPPETIVPLCAPSLAQGSHPILTPEDLSRHSLIHSEVCLVNWRDWLQQHRKVKLDLRRGLRFDRSFMAISAAVDGLGVCLESLLLAQRELETGRLVAPLGLDGQKVQAYTFNLLKSRAELPKVSSFQKWLFEELRQGTNEAAGPPRRGRKSFRV